MANDNPSPENRFTSENQPANRGRKKSILGVLSELTGDNFKRELSREQKMEIIEVMTEKSSEELSEIYNNKLNPIFIRMVANAIKSSMDNGDVKILETIWDRIYGKPAQSVNHGNADGKPFEIKQITRTIIDPVNGTEHSNA